MWGSSSEFNFQENSGGIGGSAKEFDFVGQEPTSAGPAMLEMQDDPGNYPMGPAQGMPYAPQGIMAPGPGMGYPGMGMPPMGPPPGQPTFVGRLVQGAIVGGIVAGALSYFLRKPKGKRKRRR